MSQNTYETILKKMTKPGIIIFTALIAFLILNPFVIIESGTVGVKATLGKFDNQELMPGFHLKTPIADRIIEVDTKVHTINYKGDKDLPDKRGVIFKPSINVLDERGLPVRIELTAQYRVIPDQASELLQEWGRNWEYKLVNPTIRDVVRDVIGQYPAEKLPVKRQEIAIKIEQGIKENMRKTSKGKIEVIGVQLRDIKLPPRIAQKIEEVQIAKQEAEKMKYVEEKAKKEQEVRKIRAESEKIEKIIRAEGEAERKIKEAEGKAKAKILEAEAQAKANKLLSQSIDQNILKWKNLQVQEKLMEAIKENKNNNIFLNTPQGNMHYWVK
ncbi:prohibitin family protein [Persephonella sp. KM09-Lau-8]|uniref:SPFH domain-containing protein n=1 Tax=Persephonella sp. KM09-Lau-8 TaxID=1158345 RepID=UPI0006901E3E|nr:prohibitin family protein [Persephonella sp. KM09-Lau-8]